MPKDLERVKASFDNYKDWHEKISDTGCQALEKKEQ